MKEIIADLYLHAPWILIKELNPSRYNREWSTIMGVGTNVFMVEDGNLVTLIKKKLFYI